MEQKIAFWGACVCLPLTLAAGCSSKSLNVAPAEPPAIPVSQPVERQVTDYVDFTGRIEAPEAVSVVPRVTGYLISAPFKEGAEVKKGEVLFEIDPRPYQAQYDQAEGQVLLNEARVKEAEADNARAKELAKTPGAISKQDLDRYQAAEEEAEASVQAAKASLEVYKLNLGFCKVTAPLTGQISRYYLTPGNLVNQDQTQLTTVVSVDPMYVYFDIDENTVLRVRRAVNEGKIVRYQQGEIPVFIGLEGEDGYLHEGTINFVNNQVNPGTGSITVRGVVPNPKPANGVRLLSPGMFVRVRLPIGQPHDALLVIDRAIGSDQGMKYVYTVDDKNIVQQQRVDTGALQEDGLRVIDSGLKTSEWVVIGAIQQVRPRMQITPDREPMPTLGAIREGTSAGEGKSAESKSVDSSTDSKDSNQPGAVETSPGPAKTN
ncbi:MAG TPA: efflux RND transporter periplasmic adaptor subunit [Pirellulales bacterium]|nr:efflux RND transporter periplasmic adaptor subunit [Pirellulales bacterium]